MLKSRYYNHQLLISTWDYRTIIIIMFSKQRSSQPPELSPNSKSHFCHRIKLPATCSWAIFLLKMLWRVRRSILMNALYRVVLKILCRLNFYIKAVTSSLSSP